MQFLMPISYCKCDTWRLNLSVQVSPWVKTSEFLMETLSLPWLKKKYQMKLDLKSHWYFFVIHGFELCMWCLYLTLFLLIKIFVLKSDRIFWKLRVKNTEEVDKHCSAVPFTFTTSCLIKILLCIHIHHTYLTLHPINSAFCKNDTRHEWNVSLINSSHHKQTWQISIRNNDK